MSDKPKRGVQSEPDDHQRVIDAVRLVLKGDRAGADKISTQIALEIEAKAEGKRRRAAAAP
ncbi:MAG: hypothetical protein JST92_18325 [Deltaproteobacteria bacterium]|nr:hypothetical protein [Deltaproteobacteria bacterium]